jgi:hypothetical protein
MLLLAGSKLLAMGGSCRAEWRKADNRNALALTLEQSWNSMADNKDALNGVMIAAVL